LISNRIDTEKALESRERGILAVKPEWIYECCRKWERLDWNEFKLSISGTRRQKRSAAELEETEFEEFVEEIPTFEPILDEAELEEIEKELLDLESEEEDDEDDDDSGEEGAELSDGDFSDLLNYSSSSANEEEEF
jgi:RNA polymerase II subunit A-like phosphatase